MSWSAVAKVLISLVLAIALLAGGAYLGFRYMVARFKEPPPKPIFANDRAVAKNRPTPQASAKPVTQPSASPIASPTPAQSLQPGDYLARITQPVGLILRESPSRDSTRIGGIAFNERVVVLEESLDREWQRVRVENSSREGWVKAGNVERTQ